MNRLSALDAAFLYLETPETPMHVGSVTIFAPARPQDDIFARFRDHTAARLDLLPSYRRRLATTPLGIDHPAWVIDENVDLDYHVRHAALPRPGSMAQLRAMVARLHAVPLDRGRPLWEYHLIEGLEQGAFAVYIKIHHSAMDGIAGAATLDVTFDLSPDADPAMAPRHIVRTAAEPSDFLELTSTAIADFIRQGLRVVKSLPSAARALARAAPSLTKDAQYLFRYARGVPRTPLNVAISGYRSFGTCSLSLTDVKTLAKSRGATVNDVVLALCAGALRRYLLEHHALPDAPLVAGVPASMRAPGDAKMNNQVMFAVSRLPTNLSDPLPRLAAAHVAAQEAKNLFADVKDLLTTDISILGAPLVMTAVARLMAGTRAANVIPWYFNVVISNVPGPRTPMYCVGAPARHYFPISIPYHGCALNITVQSYLDQLDFGLIAASAAVPYVERIADYLVEDFEAMRQADEALGRPDAVEAIDISAKVGVGADQRAPLPKRRKVKEGAARAEPINALERNIASLSRAAAAVSEKATKSAARMSQPDATKREEKAKQHSTRSGGGPRPRVAERSSTKETSGSEIGTRALGRSGAAKVRGRRTTRPPSSAGR